MRYSFEFPSTPKCAAFFLIYKFILIIHGYMLILKGKIRASQEVISENNMSVSTLRRVIKGVWNRKLLGALQMLFLRLTDPSSQAARAQGVDCLVAPYEADAQLAYLNKAGIVQAIITEDSDLLAFGCKKVPNHSSSMLFLSMWTEIV